jgi:hypothetical protein
MIVINIWLRKIKFRYEILWQRERNFFQGMEYSEKENIVTSMNVTTNEIWIDDQIYWTFC